MPFGPTLIGVHCCAVTTGPLPQHDESDAEGEEVELSGQPVERQP